MAKGIGIFSVWLSLVCAVFFYLYSIIGGPVAFIAFCSLALYFGQDGNWRKFPYFACSALAGVVWGWLNMQFVGVLTGFGMSFLYGAVIDIFVLTTLAMVTHLILLRNTWFNNMAYVFLGVATTFSGAESLQIAPVLICGMLIGMAGTTVADKWIFPKYAPHPPSEAKSVSGEGREA